MEFERFYWFIGRVCNLDHCLLDCRVVAGRTRYVGGSHHQTQKHCCMRRVRLLVSCPWKDNRFSNTGVPPRGCRGAFMLTNESLVAVPTLVNSLGLTICQFTSKHRRVYLRWEAVSALYRQCSQCVRMALLRSAEVVRQFGTLLTECHIDSNIGSYQLSSHRKSRLLPTLPVVRCYPGHCWFSDDLHAPNLVAGGALHWIPGHCRHRSRRSHPGTAYHCPTNFFTSRYGRSRVIYSMLVLNRPLVR
jgi:hypothetical protein